MPRKVFLYTLYTILICYCCSVYFQSIVVLKVSLSDNDGIVCVRRLLYRLCFVLAKEVKWGRAAGKAIMK